VFVAFPPDIRTRSGTFNTTTASSFISVGKDHSRFSYRLHTKLG
jgi:hypothetical protein